MRLKNTHTTSKQKFTSTAELTRPNRLNFLLVIDLKHLKHNPEIIGSIPITGAEKKLTPPMMKLAVFQCIYKNTFPKNQEQFSDCSIVVQDGRHPVSFYNRLKKRQL